MPANLYPTDMVGIGGSRYTRTSMDDLYRDYILEHYRRPHNFGVIEDADASYEGANPLCGDRITLMLGVHDGVVDASPSRAAAARSARPVPAS